MTISWTSYCVIDQGCTLPNVEWIFYDDDMMPIDGHHDFIKQIKCIIQLEEVDEVTFMAKYYDDSKKLYDYLHSHFLRLSHKFEEQNILENFSHKISAKSWDGVL